METTTTTTTSDATVGELDVGLVSFGSDSVGAPVLYHTVSSFLNFYFRVKKLEVSGL